MNYTKRSLAMKCYSKNMKSSKIKRRAQPKEHMSFTRVEREDKGTKEQLTIIGERKETEAVLLK